MTAKLVAEEGLLKGLVLSLDDGSEWVVGRDPEACQLLIEDPAVSRKHVLCRVVTNGILIENLSRTNPASVNDENVVEPRMLHHGDTVKIGSELFRFYQTPITVDVPEEMNGVEAHEEGLPQEEPETEEQEERNDSLLEEGLESSQKPDLTKVHFDLLDTGRWILKVVAGPNNGAEFSLQPGNSYLVGTDPATCDIVFHDVSVSRQHARLTLDKQDRLTIEDLKSRNGIFLGEEKLEGSATLASNTLVTLGTTTFVILDTEGERSTIISPLLPSIVKVLQREEIKRTEEGQRIAKEEAEMASDNVQEAATATKKEPPFSLVGAFILIALISGVFAVVGIGLSTLFKTQEIKAPTGDYSHALTDLFKHYPAVKFSFNDSTGRLLIVGHVATVVDRSQLLYSLQGLPYVKAVDDNIVIDELVWKEINQVITKNPEWKGVALISSTPGTFTLTGYLTSRKQYEQLNDYMSQNFPYPDLLENKVTVEEDLQAQALSIIRSKGLSSVQVSINEGNIKLSGGVITSAGPVLAEAVEEIKALPGVRSVDSQVVEQQASMSAINISNKYTVSGYSNRRDNEVTVVINGRILNVGDTLDGMRITKIDQEAIYLEKDAATYRIDYKK